MTSHIPVGAHTLYIGGDSVANDTIHTVADEVYQAVAVHGQVEDFKQVLRILKADGYLVVEVNYFDFFCLEAEVFLCRLMKRRSKM
jgi:uncharacterized protein YozE (UPF0346 family)